MGTARSKEGDVSNAEEAAAVPEPNYVENFWVVSCKPVGTRKDFSRYILLYRPDANCFCVHGLKCELLDKPDAFSVRHRQNYVHALSLIHI